MLSNSMPPKLIICAGSISAGSTLVPARFLVVSYFLTFAHFFASNTWPTMPQPFQGVLRFHTVSRTRRRSWPLIPSR